MNSAQIPDIFKDIRPYTQDELPQVFEELEADEQFQSVLGKLSPSLQQQFAQMSAALRQAGGTISNLEVQKHLIYPVVKDILVRLANGYELVVPQAFDRQTPHTFITNHRDIVLDSAFLSCMLVENGFPTTVEIAIGDNLLIYPWIKKLVRINKSFIVQRSLSMREMLRASQTMSQYMHFAVTQKRENIWIAQREGRAKDSNDLTQDSLLKMMAMGGEGTMIDRLRQLNITPMALSYELDPCDYLKAVEFQLKRDIPGFVKSKNDDLVNMQTGILGKKGHVHFEAADCINEWLDTIDASISKTDFFPAVAQHIDKEIHKLYCLYPANYLAADMLCNGDAHAEHYTGADAKAFSDYVAERLSLAEDALKLHGLIPDMEFLRERMLTMYANPVFNHEKAVKSDDISS